MGIKNMALCTCLILACSMARQAPGAEENRRSPALKQLDDLLSRPGNHLRLSSDDGATAARQFQFDFRSYQPAKQGRSSRLRLVVERDGDAHAALFLSEGDVAYACTNNGRLLLLDRLKPGKVLSVHNQFKFRLRDLADLAKFIQLTNTEPDSTIRLDVRILIEAVRKWDHTVTVDERTSTLTFINANRSRAEVRLTREKGPCRFPIASLSVKDKRGAGFTLTNFHLDGTAPQRICRLGELRNPTRMRRLDHQERQVESIKALVSSMFDVEQVARIDHDEQLRAAGMDLLQSIPTDRTFTVAQRDRMKELLRVLSAEGPTPPSLEGWMTAFDEFSALVGKETFRRAVGTFQGKDSTHFSYIIGYDRRRSAHLLEVRAGPELAASVYRVLRDVILHPPHNDPAQRIAAMDLLGSVGLPEGSTLLHDIEASVADDADGWVLTLLASLEARVGSPSDGDVAILRAAVQDETAPAKYRCVCLESLLLIDQTRGLESTMYDLVAHPPAGDLYMMRCLVTAGCSREGLDMLVRLAGTRPQHPPATAVLSVLRPAVQPGDEHWQSFLKLAKELALDEDQKRVTRSIAGRMAAVDRSDRDFRERFVDAALRSGEYGLVTRARTDYLEVDHDAHRHVAEFELLLLPPQRSRLIRRLVAEIFVTTCPVPLPAERRDDVMRLIKLMFADSETAIRLAPTRLLRRYTEGGLQMPTDLVALLLEAAREEPNDSESVALLICLSELSGGSFRVDFPTDTLGRLRRNTETMQWIRKNRRQLESDAVNWLKNQREKKQAAKPS